MSGGRAGCTGLIIPLKMDGAKAGPLPQNTRRFVHEFADASEVYANKIRALLADVDVIGDTDDPTIAESVATFTQLATIVENVTDTIRATHPE
jgi:archaellum component FlaG (FlaF/FlaG flagellin family)